MFLHPPALVSAGVRTGVCNHGDILSIVAMIDVDVVLRESSVLLR
jgi:hypothetical protein